MANIVMIPSNIDASRFDDLITRLKKSEDSDDHSLLVEHLETAHGYLKGGMPTEAIFNLELARKSANQLTDHDLSEECGEFVDSVLKKLSPAPPSKARIGLSQVQDHGVEHVPAGPSTTALELTAYFHGGGVRFGSFYPTKHLIVVVESYNLAHRGLRRLTGTGFPDKQVMAVSGDEFGKFLEDLKVSQSLKGAFMTEVSRLLDTEARLIDQYSEWARLGAGFLIVFSPTEESAGKLSEALAYLSPAAAHWFATNSIHSFI